MNPNELERVQANSNNNQNSEIRVDSLSTDRQSINENYLHNILYNNDNGDLNNHNDAYASDQAADANKNKKSSQPKSSYSNDGDNNSVHLTNSSSNTNSKISREFMEASRRQQGAAKASHETDKTFTELSDSNSVQPDVRKESEAFDSDNEIELDEMSRPGSDAENDDAEEEEHTVKLTVNILAAFPSDNYSDRTLESSNKPHAIEGPKPLNFYKFEYQLMPDEPETILSDLVTYHSAAKLFPEKSEPKLIKTWDHAGKTWAAWSQTHELRLTKSRLLKMFEHEMVLKIWDSKEHCAARTKFDKPKPFKFSKQDDANEEAMKQLIHDQCEGYLRQIPKELHNRLDRKLPTQMSDCSSSLDKSVVTNSVLSKGKKGKKSNEVSYKDQSPGKSTTRTSPRKDNQSTSRSVNNSKLTKSSKDVESFKHSSLEDSSPRTADVETTSNANKTSTRMSRPREKTKKEIAAELENLKKNGVTQIKLRMKVLFTGTNYLISRLDQSLPSMHDCFFSVNLDGNLMSEKQLKELNPLTIKLIKLTDMPNKPYSYDELRNLCQPVHCSYTFFKQPTHKTVNVAHEKNIYFNDVNVYLTGLLNEQELEEFLNGVPFEIEVHDRDRKEAVNTPQRQQKTACLFGNDENDKNISNVNAITSKHTIHNPFTAKSQHWDPHGTAKINLQELALGKKIIEYFVPILPCAAPDALGRNAVKNSQNTKIIGHEDFPLQTGTFLDAATHLTAVISLAKPLNTKTKKSRQDKTCAYGRLVVRLDSSKSSMINIIIEKVRTINATLLKLNSQSVKVQEAAVSTHKLSSDDKQDKTLDYITGFHLYDTKNNIFVLEGLYDEGIKSIYDRIPRTRDEAGIEVLYNSKLRFSKRLYSAFELELFTVKLYQPLEEIVKNPLLFIRDMTPKPSFDALIKLSYLLTEYKLRNAVRCDLLPTAKMISSLSKEFGIPDINEANKSASSKNAQDAAKKDNEASGMIINENETLVEIPHTSRVWTPIDNQNEDYINDKKVKEVLKKNFIAENIDTVHDKSEKNRVSRPVRPYIVADGPAFNYSSQTLNSTEQAINKFREYVKENTPNQLYTFNPEYHHSMTFVPVNIKQLKVEAEKKSRSEWRSLEGWIYPQVKTTMECNQHPKKPDQATLDSLSDNWEENHLHRYKMKAPVDREFYKHSERHKDFDVWSKPEIKSIFPQTIFEAGTIKELQEKQVLIEEKEVWKKKLIVDTIDVKCNRQLPATELKESGFNSSNQLDRLRGLLKDEPHKRILKYAGVNFNKVPALNVLKTEYKDEDNQGKGFVAGNEHHLRITDDKNRVPINNYEKVKFEKLKGKNFSHTLPERSPVYKRRLSANEGPSNFTNANDIFEKSKMYIIPDQADIEYIQRLDLKQSPFRQLSFNSRPNLVE